MHECLISPFKNTKIEAELILCVNFDIKNHRIRRRFHLFLLIYVRMDNFIYKIGFQRVEISKY